MKKQLLHIVLFFCIIQQLYAQTDGVVAFKIPTRNSLKFNKQFINPTFSFIREQNKYISLNNKREWVQFNDAPETYLLSYSGRFKENVGAGVSLFQQNYGVLTTFGGVVNFAYNAVLNRDSNLTFGANLGFYKSGINEGNVITNFPDSSLDNFPSNSIITINPGINYGTEFIDFGVSINNLVAYNLTSSTMIEDNPEQGIQGHIMYTGYLNSRGFFDESRFSGLITSEFRKDQTVVSGMVMLMVPKGIWVQGGYNSLYAVSAGVGLNISQQIAFEYSYEKGVGGFSTFGNSHNMTLAYKVENRERYNYSGDDDEEALLISSKNKKRSVAKRRKTKKSTSTKKVKPVVAKKQEINTDKKREAAARLKAAQDKKAKQVELAKVKLAEASRLKAVQEEEVKQAELAKAKAEEVAQAKLEEAVRLKAVQEEARQAELVKAKAEEVAQAKLEEAARLKAVKEEEAKQAELAKAKAEEVAQVKQEEAKQAELAKAKAEKIAQAKLEEASRLKAVQEEEAKQAELVKAKAEEVAQAKLEEASRLKAVKEEEAKQAELVKAKAEEVAQEKLVEAARLKAVKEEEAKQAELAKAKAEEVAQAKLAAEIKAKAEKEAKIKEIVLDEVLINFKKSSNASKNAQEELLNKLTEKVSIKQKDLDDLKTENDLSEKGIVSAPKAFKSVSAENATIESLKLEIDNSIEKGNAKITEIELLYKERLKKVKSKDDAINIEYLKTIQKLKTEQQQAVAVKQNLVESLGTIKLATDFERNRRIKRASYDNDEDRFNKDRATLERIKKFTKPSAVALTKDDFDHGEALDNIQIVKGVTNADTGYYLVVAVHNNIVKRDEFIEKAVAAGENNINFFFDINTSKYYIYYDTFDNIGKAKSSLDTDKGNKPYNSKVSIVKIEN